MINKMNKLDNSLCNAIGARKPVQMIRQLSKQLESIPEVNVTALNSLPLMVEMIINNAKQEFWPTENPLFWLYPQLDVENDPFRLCRIRHVVNDFVSNRDRERNASLVNGRNFPVWGQEDHQI